MSEQSRETVLAGIRLASADVAGLERALADAMARRDELIVAARAGSPRIPVAEIQTATGLARSSVNKILGRAR